MPQKYSKEIDIQPKTEAYIQYLVLRKTLESLSFERRKGLEKESCQEDVVKISEGLISVNNGEALSAQM